MEERESIKVLLEAVELQRSKSRDYQNPNSTVQQADYYPNGVKTIQDILHAKLLRARSLLESGEAPKHESLEDTYVDLINYASFAVAYLRGKVPGQDPTRDVFNRPSTMAVKDVPTKADILRLNEEWYRRYYPQPYQLWGNASCSGVGTVCWNATAEPKPETDEEVIFSHADRRVFHIDVGDMPLEAASAYVNSAKAGLSENHEVKVDSQGKRHYGMTAKFEDVS